MITAVFWQNPQKHIFKFSVNGHADYAELGSDIVCAAVSAMVISTINGMTEIIGIPVDCDYEYDTMLCQISSDILDQQQEQAQVLLRTLHLGLSELHKEYENYLEVRTITLTLAGGEDNAKNEHSTFCA